ncbi:MAG TPA: hypothetical protein ENJ09_08280 [Planctomycetes bacterium]|nr:hypothetical protein [Planctomycetota bacterium]
MRAPWLFPLLLLPLPCLSCGSLDAAKRSGEPDTSSVAASPLPWNGTWVPPEDWATMPPADFERLVLAALPDGTRTLLEKPTRIELGAALDRMDTSSVRAAVILGRCATEQAGNILFRRLQRRVLGPSRESDAGDVLAAAALARFPRPERWHKIARLAIGANPHPDLEVRVECAITALSLGDERTIDFLLAVMRIGTIEGLDDELDFTPSQTTAWARGRAAEALSAYAGLPLRYRADAPIADRERETRRLAEALGAR